MKKLFTGLIMGLACWAAATVSHATNYALCTGLNKYKTSYVDSSSFLNGCVPDAKNVYTNITLRGEWTKANATMFTNSQGTFAAVSNKLMSFASTAVSGDVVLYYHSSHGYQDSGKNTGICMYDQDMPDSSFAKILANFKSGVKVIIVLDTCHSGGMFKSLRRDGSTRALDTASAFAFAERVNEELAAIRADEAARGIRTAAKLAVLDCAWVTAADYNQYSWDGDEGGAFTECYVGSVKSGACDKSPYGNGDSYATFKEMFDYAVAQDDTHGDGKPGSEDYTMPQCTNTTILAAVRFGWVGKEEPSGVRFDPIPEQTATAGETLSYTLTASNSDGSSGKITFSVASATAPAGSYSLDSSSGAFSFTPATDGTFTFNFLGTNATAKTSGKAAMTVAATLAAPAKLSNSGITASSFTANWGAVAGAASYVLEVFAADSGASPSAKASDDSFRLVTSADDLTEGEYVIVADGADVAMNNTCSGTSSGYLSCTDVSVDESAVSTDDASIIWTLAGDASSCTLFNAAAGKFVNPAAAKSIGWADDASGAWTLSLSDGLVTAANAKDTSWVLQYNAGSPRFMCYSSKQKLLRFFRRDGASGAVFSGDVGNVTSFTVTDLIPGDYTWRVRAIGNAKGPFSDEQEVSLVADPTAPPSIRAIADEEIEVGESLSIPVKVSAPEEAPVTSLSITAGDAAAKLGEDGIFSFIPEAVGVYPFTITAVNANGSAEESFTVTATLAEPETPEAPAVVGSDGFTVEWTAVPGADSYELVVIEGQGGSGGGGGGGGGSGETLTETFANAEFSPGGGSYVSQTISGCDLGTWTATESRGDKGTPVFRAGGTLASPSIAGGVASVEFDYVWPFNESGTCDIDLYVGGTKVDSASVTGGTAGTASYASFDAVAGATSIEFRNTGSSNKRIQVNQVRIGTASKSIARAVGDVVYSNNVGNVTSFDVTGLQPNTEYTFAFRAIAGGEATEWSEPVGVKTADGPAAPAWTAIPAQTAAVGYPFSLDLSAYVSGVPTPTLSLTAGTADLDGTVLSFTPDAAGEYAFTVTASNSSGDPADAPFTVSAIEHVPTKYAVCVGINEYAEITGLAGCVNDSIYIENSLVERGGWAAENVVRLNDKNATKAAIRKAIADVAAKAQAGDTFVYQHSSHGGQFNDTTGEIITDETGKAVFLCVYDEDYDDNKTAYNDYEIAADMAAFNAGVKVAVIVDACHSGGLFKSKEEARAAAASFDLAGRVTAIMDADRAQRKARGENVAKTLSSSEIGWATACEYYETSYDGGFYHTDEWLTNNVYGDEYWNENTEEYNYPPAYKQGGVFTTSAAWGWWNGTADADPEAGDNDGLCDVYEFWKAGYDFCSKVGEFWWEEPEYNYYPQCTNTAVLKSVELGWVVDPRIPAPANPEAPAAEVNASSFTAVWQPVDGAASYNLYVQKRVDAKADAETLFAEDFSGFTSGPSLDIADKLDTYTAVAGWTGFKVYSDSGRAKLGASKFNGWIATPPLDLPAGAVVSAYIAQYGSDASTVSIDLSTDGGVTWTALCEPFSPTAAGATVSVSCDTDIEGGVIRFASSAGRFYLDNVLVTGKPGTWVDVPGYSPANVTGTSKVVTGLDMGTDYRFSVTAIDAEGVESLPSESVTVTTSEEDTAPIWSEIPGQSAVVGEVFTFKPAAYVKASPAATITVTGSSLADGEYQFADGTLTFTPAAEGTYTFGFQAANTLGVADATLTVVAAAAPVTVPTLSLSNQQATSFDASWTACDGVSSYTLQVATDNQFSTGSSAGTVELFNNPASSATAPEGWTYNISSKTAKYVVLDDTEQSVVSPAVSTKGMASLTIVFKSRTYGGTGAGVALVEYSADGGSTWAEVGTAEAENTTMASRTINAAKCIGLDSVKFRWTAPLATGSKGIGIQDLVLSGEGSGGDGSLVKELTVEGTSTTVDGLDPDTLYFARVKGASDWSAVESIATTGEGPAGPAKYAVCVGLSEYDMAAFAEMGLEVTPLKGCVNDATYLKKNLAERGGWDEGNVSLLTNGSATKAAIRGAIAAAAQMAKAGDTFVYEHSSHGLQGDEEDDYTVALATYDSLYEDAELAEDLASFADGVKVVVLVDACHSGGLFDDGTDAGTDGKARSAASFDIAARVSALIDANRAARKARGEDVSRTLTADQIGWVTAAAYEETSKDGGYYDTDAWMSDDEAEGEERGGTFLAALAWGWWSGKADVSGEGDGDGWFDAYEGWSFSTPVCAEYDQTPQYLNEDVLRSVELGWVGDTVPSEALVFDPVPGAEVAIGEEATLTVVAKNADGTTDGITLSIVATDPEGLEYAFADGALAFTPAEDGLFLFTVQAVKGRLSATKILGVTAVLPAPVAQEVEDADISEDGFTARWLGVDAARNYQIQVSTDPDFPMGEPEQLIEEGFDEVTDKASLPEEWEFEGSFDVYATGGEAAPSIKLSTDGATLTTPSFELKYRESGLSFWTKGNGSGTNMTSTLTVQQLVGKEWQTLEGGTFVPSPAGETKEFEGLDANATRIRFVMAKTSGNIAIDDVMVAQLSSPVLVDEDEIDADSSSYEVEDLLPGTTYYFRVRAIANTKSAWSEVIEVTTAGEAPIPVPDLTVFISETDPDTSLFAFWICPGVSEFRLQVATDEEFASLVVNELLSESTKTVGGLTPETTYYVRVCGLVGERVGDWSSVETVTTEAGGEPPVEEPYIQSIEVNPKADSPTVTLKLAVPTGKVRITTDLAAWGDDYSDPAADGILVLPMGTVPTFYGAP